MRISAIDGLRGFFLAMMTMAHLSRDGHTLVGTLNHHRLGWVEDAQGFVFLSGLVIGIVYGKRLIRQSRAAMLQGLITRTRTIYIYHALLMAAITLGVLLFYTRPSDLDPGWSEAPLLFSAFGFLLISAPRYLDILPMYAIFVALTPIVLIQLQKGRYALIMTTSVALWALAQTGLPTHLLQAIGEATGLDARNIHLGLYFNRFAWQILYVGGLVAGMLLAQERLSPDFLHHDDARTIFFICLALSATFAITAIRLRYFNALPQTGFFGELSYNRNHFSALRLLNFLADLYVVSWLLIAGRTDRNPFLQAAARALHALASFRPLVFIGQHSLQVFAFHVLLAYAAIFFSLSEAPRLLREIMVLVSPACLLLPAYLHARHRDKGRRLRISGA
ncbi:OpgC family protein [Rhodovulum sp. YEN HP10]|uniref:OpgC family protein n=1 Tax=Rhodovulum sp. HP10 TaxID=3387397 RepID=UPI0039DF6511